MRTLAVRAAIGLAAVCTSVATAVETAPPPRLVDRTPAEEQARAYRALFENVGRAGLPELAKSKDTSLALQASWELHKKLVKRPKLADAPRDAWTYDSGQMKEFLGFLIKRAEAPVPKWWADTLLVLAVEPGAWHMTSVLEKDFAFREIRLGQQQWRVRDEATLRLRDTKLVFKAGKAEVEYPIRANDTYWNTFASAVGEKYACVANYNFTGAYPFQIHGFATKDGTHIWIADVWAHDRGKVPVNGGRHRAEVSIKGDTVYVFGTEFGGLYIEAFDVATGKCRFRFCTSYWGNYSEKWDTD